MGRLFGDIKNLKAGIASGEHVIHLTVNNDENTKIIYSGEWLEEDDKLNLTYSNITTTEEVTQEQVYNNKANENTARFFMTMAGQLDSYYEDYADDDKDFKKVCENIRDYLVANRRSTQQKTSDKMLASIAKYLEAADKKLKKEANPESSTTYTKMNIIRDFQNSFSLRFNGDLKMDSVNEEIQNSIKAKDIEEPSYSGVSGALSRWKSAENKQLFPHEPSPTDIKQGIGIEDCYMQSCLIKIADTNPEKIRNAMKDNGDGTVTVRFYDNVKDPETDKEVRKPVYIRVNKTESVMIGTGAASYASGSLWVQMMEKAYAKYKDRQAIRNGMPPQGLAGISLGNAYQFLNAFEEDPKYTHFMLNNKEFDEFGFNNDGSINQTKTDISDLYCDNMYKFLLANQNETLVVGANHNDKAINSTVKSLGIRTGHAYPIMKVFELDGEKYVQLREPYATYETKYDESGKLKDATSNGDWWYRGIKSGSDNMGTINLKMRDFVTIFTDFTGISKDNSEYFRKNVADPCYDLRNKKYEQERQNKQINADIAVDNQNGASNILDDFEVIEGDNKSNAIDGFEVIEGENKSNAIDGFEVIEGENKSNAIDGFEVIEGDNKSNGFDDFEVIENENKAKNPDGFEVIESKEVKEVDGFELFEDERKAGDPNAWEQIDDNRIKAANPVKAPVERDEYDRVRHAMSNFASDLIRVESRYRNSDIYKNLKNAVNELSTYKYNPEDGLDKETAFKNKLTSICNLVDQYVAHKSKGADATSQNKLAVAITIKGYANSKIASGIKVQELNANENVAARDTVKLDNIENRKKMNFEEFLLDGQENKNTISRSKSMIVPNSNTKDKLNAENNNDKSRDSFNKK